MKKELLAALALTANSAFAADQPNIVMLFVDDLGWTSLGYQDNKFETPNINQLKEDGLYLERTYVPTATSSPSRATLMTGKEALRCGFTRHIYEGDKERNEFQLLEMDPGQMLSRAWLPLEEITYAERLKDNGYYNYFIGKWHLGHEPYYPVKQGFDDMYGTCEAGHPGSYIQPFFKENNPLPDVPDGAYLTDELTKGATKFIADYNKKKPFLLNFWYYTVHTPHAGRADYEKYYLDKGMSKTDATFAAMVHSLDDSVGEIRKALKEKGIEDNTIIMFTSDQGGYFSNAPLRGGKTGGDTLAEGGCRVPTIIYYPGAKAMGTTYSKPVSTMDFYPTMVEIASGKPCKDKQIQGMSLMPVINGGEQADRTLYLHRSYEEQNCAIIEGDWKLIYYRSGKSELYNIKEDIGEKNDLSLQEPIRKDRMLGKVLAWREEATPKELITPQPGNTMRIAKKIRAAAPKK